MRPRVIVLGIAAFLLALLAVLPARWVAGALPAQVTCAQWRGSVWRGGCNGLALARPGAAPLQLDALQWRVRPLALFTLTLRADFSLRFAGGEASGRLDARGGNRVSLRPLRFTAMLDHRLAGALPAGWNGALEGDIQELSLEGPTLRQLAGSLRVRDFNDGRGAALGSYEVAFEPAAGAPFTGRLRDAGGPLEVAARLVVAADRSWTLDGTVAARPGASAALVRQLDLLSAPDASGRRQLSAAGSSN